MMLIEQTTVPAGLIPVAQFKDHLRLGSGFADDAVQDTVLETCLRAALTTIEGRVGKAIFRRQFIWSITAWRDQACQPIPISPVAAIDAISIVDRAGTPTSVAAESYSFKADLHRPVLIATIGGLPSIPTGGAAEIIVVAGFADTWSELPPDLQQATLMLAASYYEDRHGAGISGPILPKAVSAILEAYRAFRLSRGTI